MSYFNEKEKKERKKHVKSAINTVNIFYRGTRYKALTGRSKLEWEVPEEALPGDVRHGPEDDDGPREAGVTQRHPLVGGELGHALAPHQVLPVVLHTHTGTIDQIRSDIRLFSKHLEVAYTK